MEKLSNTDGIELSPPYEENGKWMAEDGWGCVLDFDTFEEAWDFQLSLTPERHDSDTVVLFDDSEI